MGRTKSRPRSINHKQRKFLGLCPTPRQRLERCNIYKLCVAKLARIDDPQAKLCKAVLINNTLKKLEKQPDYLHSSHEPEESMQEVNTNFNITNLESLYSRLQRQNKSSIESRLLSEGQNVPDQGDCIQDTLSLCDDIIKEFLGVPEPSALCDSAKDPCDKENYEGGGQEEEESGPGGHLVSPYSYSSFLSEVYSITLRKIKYKVEL